MKKKITSIIIAAFALILSGCAQPQQSSSITSSVPSTSSVEESTSSISSTTSSSQATSSNTSSNTSTSTSSSTTSSSSSASSSTPSGDPVWNINISLRGAEFRNALQTIMNGKRTTTATYSECKSIGARAAAYPNANSSTFVPFYHDATRLATQSECNREHMNMFSRLSIVTVLLDHCLHSSRHQFADTLPLADPLADLRTGDIDKARIARRPGIDHDLIVRLDILGTIPTVEMIPVVAPDHQHELAVRIVFRKCL